MLLSMPSQQKHVYVLRQAFCGRRCEAGLLWQAAPASSPMLAEIKSAKSATMLPWPVIHVDIQVNDDIDQASPIRLINYLIDVAENWSIT